MSRETRVFFTDAVGENRERGKRISSRRRKGRAVFEKESGMTRFMEIA